MPRLPKLKPPDPESLLGIIDKAGDAINNGLKFVDRLADRIDRLADKLGPPEETETEEAPRETKTDEECPVCSELTNLREYVGKRKVKRALDELEKSGDKESVETIRKYIEGEDVV